MTKTYIFPCPIHKPIQQMGLDTKFDKEYYEKQSKELLEIEEELSSVPNAITLFNKWSNTLKTNSFLLVEANIDADLTKNNITDTKIVEKFKKALKIHKLIYSRINDKKNYKKVDEILDYEYLSKIPAPLVPCEYTKQNCFAYNSGKGPRDIKCCDKGKLKILRCGVNPKDTGKVGNLQVPKGCYDKKQIQKIKQNIKDGINVVQEEYTLPTKDRAYYSKYTMCPLLINENETYCNNVFDFSYDFSQDDTNAAGIKRNLENKEIKELESKITENNVQTKSQLDTLKKEIDKECSNDILYKIPCGFIKDNTFCTEKLKNKCKRTCGLCPEITDKKYHEKLVEILLVYEISKQKKSDIIIERKENEKITGQKLSEAVYDNVKSLSSYGKILLDPNIGVGNDYLISTHKCIDDYGKEQYIQTPIHASGDRVNNKKKLADAINKSVKIIDPSKLKRVGDINAVDIQSSNVINQLKEKNRDKVVNVNFGSKGNLPVKITEEIYSIVNTEPSSGLVYGLIDDIKDTNPVSLLARFMAQSENASMKCKDIAKLSSSYPFTQYSVREAGKDLNENVQLTTVKENPIEIQGCYIVKEGFSKKNYFLEIIIILVVVILLYLYF